MKKGCWENGPKNFGTFEFKGETITIDTEEKYLYWNEKLDIQNDDSPYPTEIMLCHDCSLLFKKYMDAFLEEIIVNIIKWKNLFKRLTLKKR